MEVGFGVVLGDETGLVDGEAGAKVSLQLASTESCVPCFGSSERVVGLLSRICSYVWWK